MQHIKAVRRERLRKLIETEYGTQVRFAEETDSNTSHISQIVNGVRGMGEEFARSLERKANKPKGWFDGIDDPLSLLEPGERALIERYRQADRRGQKIISSVAESQSDYAPEDD